MALHDGTVKRWYRTDLNDADSPSRVTVYNTTESESDMSSQTVVPPHSIQLPTDFHGSPPWQKHDRHLSWTVEDSTVSFGHAWLADDNGLLGTVSTTHNSWASRWQADLGWSYASYATAFSEMQEITGRWENVVSRNLQKTWDCLRSSVEKCNHVKPCMQLCNISWV